MAWSTSSCRLPSSSRPSCVPATRPPAHRPRTPPTRLNESRAMELTDRALLVTGADDAQPRRKRLPLLDQVLREQQELTAVERFAQRHAETHAPLQEPFYRQLLPATPPGPGQQYA